MDKIAALITERSNTAWVPIVRQKVRLYYEIFVTQLSFVSSINDGVDKKIQFAFSKCTKDPRPGLESALYKSEKRGFGFGCVKCWSGGGDEVSLTLWRRGGQKSP